MVTTAWIRHGKAGSWFLVLSILASSRTEPLRHRSAAPHPNHDKRAAGAAWELQLKLRLQPPGSPLSTTLLSSRQLYFYP
jgi:hypothetical protein